MTEGMIEAPAPPLRWPRYVALATVCYSLVCLVLFIKVRRATGGHILFVLDDPYIHLALAEQIAHGHYGLNPGEAASPSSSILWPFLLAPFSSATWQPMATFLLNFLAGLGTAAAVGYSVAIWPGHNGSRGEAVRRSVSVVALILIGNLVGLTFIGMEHTLQGMLAALCALGMIAAMQGREIPAWCLVAAGLAPLVRYEDLTLTLAVAVCLAGQRKLARAAGLIVAAVAPLLAFSLFLHRIGLPLLPLSVMLKGGVAVQASGGQRIFMLKQMILQYQTLVPDRMVVLVLCFMLVELAVLARDRVHRYALAGAAAAAAGQLLLGPFGWFHRYEVYMVLFSAMLILYVLHERPRMLTTWYLAILLVCGSASWVTTSETVNAAEDVYLQQYQMHRFVTQFASGNIAVNDLGVVAYRRRPGQRVLDLVGLGSLKTARDKGVSPEWLDGMTRRNDIAIVMVYADRLYPRVPATWTTLGVICSVRPPVALWSACVSYYATPMADVAATQTAFNAFTATLPAGAKLAPQSR